MRQFKPGQLQSGSLYPITASHALTASYLSGSISIDTGSLVTTASFNAFTASYTTGSFTGSFKGDGSQLTGIVSSKWTGSNPISRQSDVEITGSLRVQGSITGSLFGTASNAVSSSFASTASFVNPLIQNVLITGSLTATSFTGSLSGSVSAPGSSSQVIFNNANVLSADAGFTYSGSKLSLGQLNVDGEVILNRSSTGTTVGGIRAIPGGTEIGGSGYLDRIRLTNGSGLQFFTFTSGAGNAERMRITSGTSGVGVGIGTTTVSASLHVSGADSAALLKIDSPSNPNILFVTGSGRIGIGTSTPVDVVEIVGYSKYIQIAGTSATDRSAWIGNDANGTGNMYLFNGSNTNTVFITGNGNSFLNGGNVGIGIYQQPSISASLHISGTNAATLLRLDAPGSSSILHVTGSGRIGIGTSTPASLLHLSAVDPLITINNQSTSLMGFEWRSANTTYAFNGIASNNGAAIVGSALGDLYFRSINKSIIYSINNGASIQFIISSSGNVGIGKTTPNARLDVSGSAIITGSLIVTQGITGSLFGTASWAENSITASFVTASGVFGPYGSNSIISASYALQALSSSYANFATSASHTLFAETASNSLNAQDILIYVLNNSGYNIPKGTVVHITASGNSSDTPRIISASYENDSNSANTLGITNESIANGANGYVMTEGVLKGVDTSAFVSGQMVYLGASGSIIGYAPQAPLHAVRLGQVVRVQQNNGSIYVRIDNGYELDELHDVRIMTASLQYGDLLMRSGSVWTNTKQLSGSYDIAGTLTATHITASDLYAGATYISGSLTVVGQSTFYGTASFVNVTASNLFVSESFISVNVFEPVERFGGLKVYDSGSSTATASLAWDSLHNHWVYQNVDGLTYTGGMLLSGPRNTGSLGDEPNLTKWFVPRSDGGDHLDNSQIFTSGSVTQITGSLTVTNGVTASLHGNALTATTASHALISDTIIPLSGLGRSGLITFVSSTGSAAIVRGHQTFNVVIDNAPSATVNLTGSLIATSITSSLQGTATSASYALTASYLDNYIPPFPYTGSASITGSLDITGSLETSGSSVYHKTNLFVVENIDVNASLIEATTAGGVYIWSTDSNPSADFESRAVFDSSGQVSIDWASRKLNDQFNNNIIDYSGASGYSIVNNRPTIELLTLGVQDAFTQTSVFSLGANAAGNIINVETNVDLAVTASNPVFLDTDGIWKRTDQTTDTTTKLLGICAEPYNKGLILTEGIITVTTASGYADTMPFVSGSSFYGMPVYLTGSAATFTTDKPTSGYVRVVGHMYYNSTSTPDYWIMKFNPSNDWYEI